jgi:hypothetical protein
VPYVVRAVLLLAVFVVAYVVMHDLGFEPRRIAARDLPGEIASNARAGVEFGWRQPGLRLLILASTIQTGFFAWAFYASPPYLLGLLDSDATWIAGLIAAGIALSTIAGNQVVSFASRYCGRRTTLPARRGGVETAAAVAVGLASSFWVALAALLVMTASMGSRAPSTRLISTRSSRPSSARPSSRSTR